MRIVSRVFQVTSISVVLFCSWFRRTVVFVHYGKLRRLWMFLANLFAKSRESELSCQCFLHSDNFTNEKKMSLCALPVVNVLLDTFRTFAHYSALYLLRGAKPIYLIITNYRRGRFSLHYRELLNITANSNCRLWLMKLLLRRYLLRKLLYYCLQHKSLWIMKHRSNVWCITGFYS